MRKATLTILILLVSSIATFAQEHKERSAPPQRPPQTQMPPQSQPQQGLRYTSPAGRYSISFPSGKQPQLSSQNITDPNGKLVPQYLATVVDGTDAFMVAYFDYGPGIVFNLDKARDGMLSSLNGTLLEEHAMSLGGSPGRELRFAARTAEGIDFMDRARFYNVTPRIYVLQCVFPKANDGPSMAERCEQFLDSFRVRNTP